MVYFEMYSRTVVMEVDIRYGVCYNSPADSRGPVNYCVNSAIEIML